MTVDTLPDTLVSRFARLAEASPDSPAITCADVAVSRSELERKTNRLARAYVAAGVRHNSLVTIGLPNSVEFLEAAIAVWKCGATPQPISSRLPAREREAIIALADPSLVVGVSQQECPGRAVIPAGFAPDPSLSDEPLDLPPATAWKAPTSGGSTGRPKLIVSTQGALVDAVEPFARLLGMADDGRVLITGPLYHNAPFMLSACALAVGAHVVLMPRFDAASCVALAAEHDTDWVYLVPTMMGRISRLAEADKAAFPPPSLRVVMHMAAPCPAWLKREWIDWVGPDRVWELYAATEVQSATVMKGGEWLERPGTVGKPLIGEMKILDAAGDPVPAGTVGELWMRRGEGVANPYRYIGAEARFLAGGWESVGDMASIDEDGYVFLADRKTDMILVGGSNVYPAEIEAALSEHPLVLSAVVIGLPHDDLGQVPHALVELESEVADEALRSYLSQRLVSYKVPRSFERVDGPTRDDAGKVRRGSLVAERTVTP